MWVLTSEFDTQGLLHRNMKGWMYGSQPASLFYRKELIIGTTFIITHKLGIYLESAYDIMTCQYIHESVISWHDIAISTSR